WSFRGQGTGQACGSESFFHQALTVFGDSNPDRGPEEAKAIRLIERLRAHRTLLVLDGLEPLQSPPTVWEAGGKILSAALRAFILNLAANLNGLCVLTSRFPIWDLQDQVGEGPAGKVWLRRLGPLDQAAATSLLRARGLHGPDQHFIE